MMFSLCHSLFIARALPRPEFAFAVTSNSVSVGQAMRIIEIFITEGKTLTQVAGL